MLGKEGKRLFVILFYKIFNLLLSLLFLPLTKGEWGCDGHSIQDPASVTGWLMIYLLTAGWIAVNLIWVLLFDNCFLNWLVSCHHTRVQHKFTCYSLVWPFADVFYYRSLQIHQETGVAHSRWLEEQRGQEGGDKLGGPLRYPDPCIFWLQADMEGKDGGVEADMWVVA